MMKFVNRHLLGRLRKDQTGVSAVEFAIVVYPLVHIMIGIMNFGYTFYAYNTIQNMAIETVRSHAHGSLGAAEAVRYADAEAEKFGGSFDVTIDRSQPGSIEIILVGDSSAFELVSFPYSSIAQFRDTITLKHRTPTYNTNPYTL
ncbi:TadE/TadG family type IV pilus assembly protein [Parasphingorhabdus sp.]|jgi:hypothetical protein|uniref:TadE/TadG family type IV pilus assembly protein n=1 Tax=Parasphingorhabdus sp. TaxID=2709688 RepID=UPI003D295CD6